MCKILFSLHRQAFPTTTNMFTTAGRSDGDTSSKHYFTVTHLLPATSAEPLTSCIQSLKIGRKSIKTKWRKGLLTFWKLCMLSIFLKGTISVIIYDDSSCTRLLGSPSTKWAWPTSDQRLYGCLQCVNSIWPFLHNYCIKPTAGNTADLFIWPRAFAKTTTSPWEGYLLRADNGRRRIAIGIN